MIHSAANSDYPKFVADQVLTSDNLNDLFGYLDEQGRMTRTNLIGIGIVCGLEVKTAADGSSITITKGVGVTSSGYLVSVPEIKYTKRTSGIFDAVKSEYYNKFVNIASKTQKFNLWELKQEAESEGTTALTKTFLTTGEKIVLLFVELLEENNKNCDPNSCDDKGILVTVNIRPLLVEKANVGDLLTGTGENDSPWLSLPEITMKRFDVTATPLYECLNFFNAYRKILSDSFLNNTQISLTKAYEVLQPLLADEFPTNPFASLVTDFKFLNDGNITSEQLIVLQYYYDLFCDILLAYSEFRKAGIEFIGLCCPDDIFQRHLLLDLAIPDTTTNTSSYRHYFIPSPILSSKEKTAFHLKVLFKKLVLLVKKFAVPSTSILGANRKVDNNIRITPSVLANVPLSTKSIPYYYAINNATDELLKNWSPLKLMQGKSNRNLSFHAVKYNTTDEDIYTPLLYDLEPYNFLRIEGHIGKHYQHVVKNIADIRDRNRLPFEIVALNADVYAIDDFIKNLGKLMTSGNTNAQSTLESIVGTTCHFNDLELLYDSIMAELTGKLSNEMKFFYDLNRDARRPPLSAPNSNVPQVPLLVNSDATFRFTTNSMGHEFELFYVTVKNHPFISLEVFFQSFGQAGNTDAMDFVFKAVLYYIEMLYETVTTSLSSFTFFDFYNRYYTLIQAVRYIKLLNKFFNEQFPLSEEENDHLDGILSITADNRMVQLYMEFLRRVLHVKIMQQAGFYVINHPGIQHKAGVPLGGTFIVVYHETDRTETITANTSGRESLVFDIDTTGRKLANDTSITDNVREKKSIIDTENVRENKTTTEYLEILSAGVREKVSVAGERILVGVRKSINITNTRTKAESLVTEEKNSVRDVSSISTNAQISQNSNQNVLKYLMEAAVYLKNRKTDKLDEVIEDFNDGVVIADFYLPYLCCSDCPPIQMIVIGEPEQQNLPPVARPGDSVSVQLPTEGIILDGSSSSDPDGTIKAYLWELQSGPEAIIENLAESKTKVSGLQEGMYIFKLTVTDDDGTSASDTVTVTVLPLANVPPVAKGVARPDVVTLTVNGTGITQLNGKDSTDPDGTIVSFVWLLSSGPTGGSVINNPESDTTMVTFTQVGNYVFKLIVKDDKGATDTTSVNVTVTREEENQPPVAKASATPSTLVLVPGQASTVQLDSSGSTDPDGEIKSFNWSLSSGPTSGSVIINPNLDKTLVTFTQPGAYAFKLIVTDDKGATDTTSLNVTVTREEENRLPVAKASATPSTLVLVPGQASTVQLDSSGSTDPDGEIKAFNWSLSSGPTSGSVITNPNLGKTQVTFTQPGAYIFKLIVTDDKGATDSTSVNVTVVQEGRTQKTCVNLNEIISDFDKLGGADTAVNFRSFSQRYTEFREISAFYALMKTSNVANMPVDEKIKFFIERKIESRLVVWIENLRMFFIEIIDLRLLALLMFNIHTQLAYYISCIQKEDVNEAEVKMAEALTSVIKSLSEVQQFIANFPPDHRKVLSTLGSISTDERKRVSSNNEESAKPAYGESLTAILNELKSMNL